ncbi:hypothetical protein [Rubrivirga sp. IMCC45206]|uniref:DUF3108 domain-containing protein n=1 Tax=Rubrivirga sp. IMCC45206 TaxID=3391614 RepID=UPI00398FCB1A
MRLLLLSLLLAASASAQAPDTLALAPGDGALTTDWLTPGTRAFTVRLVAPVQQDVGTATQTISLADGVVTRVTTMAIPSQGMSQTDSLVADAASLAPMTHSSAGGMAEISLEFMDEGVAGMVAPRQGEAATVLLMTDGPVFDGGWLGEIAQSVALDEGAVYTVPAFFAQSPEEQGTAVLTVGASEAVGDRTGVAVAGQMGPVTMTYLVDPDTRELLVTRFSPQPGVRIEIAPAD